jgi:FSR family fosmidomycin resistance protein-like MFS transporter
MKNLRSILSLSAAHLVIDTYSPVLPAILPLLIVQNGYPYFIAGLIVTVWNITSSLTQPVIGWLYDRKGFAIHIGYSVLLAAVFISLIGIVDNYYMILLFAAIGALGHAFFHPSALGMVSRLAHDSSRGRLTSYFVVGGNLGFAIGPILAGIVIGAFGLTGLPLLLVPGLIVAGVLLKVMPRKAPPSQESSQKKSEDKKRSSRMGISLLVSGAAFRSWAIFASVAFLPTFLTQEGFDVVTANLLVSCMLVAGVIGQVAGGMISDQYGRKEYTLAGLVCAIPPFYLFLNSTGYIAVIALLIFGFCLWSTFSVTVAMAHELMPDDVGLISGLMLGFAVGAGGVGVGASGWLADLYPHLQDQWGTIFSSPLQFALTLLILPILIAILLFFLVPYPWKRRSPEAELLFK